eukprot:COSAG02_NODE_2639_length_8352_cov_5.696959_3_plen_78_part_00
MTAMRRSSSKCRGLIAAKADDEASIQFSYCFVQPFTVLKHKTFVVSLQVLQEDSGETTDQNGGLSACSSKRATRRSS